MEQDQNYRDRGLGFLLICLLLVLLFGYLVLRPFLNIFLMALVLATFLTGLWLREERRSPLYALLVLGFLPAMVLGRVPLSGVPSAATCRRSRA